MRRAHLVTQSLDALGLPSRGGVMINHVPARRLIELHETSRFFDELEEHAAAWSGVPHLEPHPS